MLNVTFKSLWARKRRLAGTFVAVVLGVAFLSGTLVLGDTLRANFDRLFTTVTRGTSAQVRSATKIGVGRTGSDRGTIDSALSDGPIVSPTWNALPVAELASVASDPGWPEA